MSPEKTYCVTTTLGPIVKSNVVTAQAGKVPGGLPRGYTLPLLRLAINQTFRDYARGVHITRWS